MNDKSNTQSVELEGGESIDILDIMRMIPHRYPFLMIDRVDNIILDQSAVGIKNVTINEPFFEGHFPRKPVMPGVLIIEAMAQTGCCLVMKTLGHEVESKLVYFMSIDNARFRKQVGPGDQLKIHMEKVRARGQVWKLQGKAYVDGALVAEAVVTAIISDE